MSASLMVSGITPCCFCLSEENAEPRERNLTHGLLAGFIMGRVIQLAGANPKTVASTFCERHRRLYGALKVVSRSSFANSPLAAVLDQLDAPLLESVDG